MNISKFSDYSFRILIFLGNNQGQMYTVDDLSTTLDLSSHHLKKIVHKLSKFGYVSSIKGRNGGIRLGITPDKINLGSVFKDMEDNLDIVECFSQEKNKCNFNGYCKLKPVLYDATNLFIETLSKYTLADIID